MSLPKIAKEKFNVSTLFTPYNYYLIDPNMYMFNSDFTNWKNTDFFENSEYAKRFPEKRLAYQRRLDFCKQLMYEYFDLFLAVSRRQKEIFYEFVGNVDKIIVVHQANKVVDELWGSKTLEIEARRRLPEKLRIGYLGGVYPSKGVHNFVSAAQHFLPNDAEFHIYGFVVGKYRQLLEQLDIKKRIIYHHNYTEKDLEQIAKEIDIGVCSSIYEDPAPFVLGEMNAMRLPVLGSKIGGIPDFVVDGVTGFLFEPNDVASMVSAIRYCL
ncbi:MAG: glycosyltransferase, partial [Candidatus Kapaibacteriota bacterium]